VLSIDAFERFGSGTSDCGIQVRDPVEQEESMELIVLCTKEKSLVYIGTREYASE
jgi:hypothetical protein